MAFRLEIADFGSFYERTYDLAYRTALGIVRDHALAADVTQEAFVSAYRSRDRFRGEAPSGAWLHRIVVNKALSAIRRHPVAARDADLARFVTPDDATRTTSRLALIGALERLPARPARPLTAISASARNLLSWRADDQSGCTDSQSALWAARYTGDARAPSPIHAQPAPPPCRSAV